MHISTKYALATAVAALALLSSSVAFADTDRGADVTIGAHGGMGLSLGSILGAHDSIKASAGMSTGKNDNDADDSSGTKAQLRTEIEAALSHITAGVVTAVDGSSFVIDPIGKRPTTTVSTTAATTFKEKGAATSSSALQVGDRVLLFGTTTATSTTADDFAASFVRILGNGFAHLRLWFHLK